MPDSQNREQSSDRPDWQAAWTAEPSEIKARGFSPWACKRMESQEAEVARLRAAIHETLCDDEPCARCRHLREALNETPLASDEELAPAETTQDLRTHIGGGLYVKPLGHTPPEEENGV